MQERQKHIDAFEMFYKLGGQPTTDNCTKVAEEFQISARTFWNWYKELNWKEQVILRNRANKPEIQANTDREVVKSKADHLAAVLREIDQADKIIQRYEKLIADASEKINKGEIAIASVPELGSIGRTLKDLAGYRIDLRKQALVLMGEADSRTDHNIRLIDLLKAGREQSGNDND